jgi:hypothetical protein
VGKMLFNQLEEYYQAIGEDLLSLVQGPWVKIQATVERDEDFIQFETEITRPDGLIESDIDPFLTNIPEYFSEIATLISTVEKGLFKKCIFLLNADGSYKADYEY